MSRIAAVTACPTGIAHTEMAAEALKKAAPVMGHTIKVETQGSAGTKNILSAQDIADADVIVLAADIRVDPVRFAGKPIYEVRTSEAIRNTKTVIEAALAHAAAHARPQRADGSPRVDPELVAAEAAPATPETQAPEQATAAATSAKRLVGITSCPTGIAHTFMAAEALQKAARSLGHTIKVETQGSVGAKNQLTDEDIAAADAVVIAADTKVDITRFAGKPVYMTSTKQAMHNGQEVIRTALTQPVAGAPGESLAESVQRAKAERSASRTGPYKHLMTGVSYMLPLVVAGGLSIALAFAFGGIRTPDNPYEPGTLAAAFNQIGGTAFSVFIGILAAFIAYSIADRPGIVPGLVGGLLASTLNAGFLGGLLAGFLAGYLTKFLADTIRLPVTLQGLMPVLILPFLSTVIVGLLMIYVIGPPVSGINTGLTAWLQGLQGANRLLLGLLLGAMMAFDMGGPVNKAAYAFSVGLLASAEYRPMAAVMAAGMTPPLGLALAALLFKNRFDEEEREAAPAAAVLGLSFITEGAIPFAAKDPLRVIPSLMLGSAVAGALSMLFNIGLLAPHGGIFVTFIPNAVTSWLLYLIAIVAGTLVTTAAIFALKKHPVSELAEATTTPEPEQGPLVTKA